MDTLSFIILASCSALGGTAVGFLICSALASRKLRRASADSWKAAHRYYSSAYNLTPKN